MAFLRVSLLFLLLSVGSAPASSKARVSIGRDEINALAAARHLPSIGHRGVTGGIPVRVKPAR
jgi:hypothetical protein